MDSQLNLYIKNFIIVFNVDLLQYIWMKLLHKLYNLKCKKSVIFMIWNKL
jgi:hypothetical protein